MGVEFLEQINIKFLVQLEKTDTFTNCKYMEEE